MSRIEYIVGTSGYSFADWVGPFYPPGTRGPEMLRHYVRHFQAVELNFTFYRIPEPATLDRIARIVPEGFRFWVKASQQLTHQQDRSISRAFLDGLSPLRERGILVGILLQFPQSFHRTIASRRFLSDALADLKPADLPVPAGQLAVEFRHRSWGHPSTVEGLTAREVALVVPDVPDLPDLHRPPPTATTRTGYLRLHSRNPANWYAGGADRYDYSYSEAELTGIASGWQELADQVDRVYAFFNNCHRGQAAQNAEAFRRIVAGL